MVHVVGKGPSPIRTEPDGSPYMLKGILCDADHKQAIEFIYYAKAIRDGRLTPEVVQLIDNGSLCRKCHRILVEHTKRKRSYYLLGM